MTSACCTCSSICIQKNTTVVPLNKKIKTIISKTLNYNVSVSTRRGNFNIKLNEYDPSGRVFTHYGMPYILLSGITRLIKVKKT